MGIKIAFDELAFDHGEILKTALTRLVNKAGYSDIALMFLGNIFTISDIKLVMEAITGRPFNNVKRAFASVIEEIADKNGEDVDSPRPAHRPAACFRRKADDNSTPQYKATNQPMERIF